jgi:hypothetical protein
VRPDFGHVEWVESVVSGVLEGHDLHLEPPHRVLAMLDGVPQIGPVEVGILGRRRLGLGIGEVLDALLRLEVVLDPEPLTSGVDPHEGVGAVAVHVAKRAGCAPVRHENRDLMGAFWREGPKIPLAIVVGASGVRPAFLGVDEVRELGRIPDEEDRGVIAD